MEAMVIDDGFRDGARDFGWKPAEVVALLGAEGNRVIGVVVDAVGGSDLGLGVVTHGGPMWSSELFCSVFARKLH